MWERLDPEIHHIGAYIHSATFALCGRPGSRYSPEDLLLHTQVPAFDTEPVHTARQTTIAIEASCSVQYIFRACIKRIRWKKVCIDPLHSCFRGRISDDTCWRPFKMLVWTGRQTYPLRRTDRYAFKIIWNRSFLELFT